MPVIYCTSTSQCYRRILRYARKLVLELGSGQTRLQTIPPRLLPREQVEWAQLHMVESSEWQSAGWLVVASTFELPILRALAVIRRAHEDSDDWANISPRFSVHVLADPKGALARGAGPSVFPLRVEQRGEFLDPWPEGFFEERVPELFG